MQDSPRPVFRPLPFWQSAMMTLPDTAFFELMRSALGTVKTPFNKQNLLEDLSQFASRPEIQETMAALLDHRDQQIIAAVALLGEPVPGELESFFTGEYSYAELQETLLNMEERLILYRFRDGDVLRLALNPRLESILAPAAADTALLFQSLGPEEAAGLPPPRPPAIDSRVLAAFFSFLFGGGVFFRSESQDAAEMAFRKKFLDEGAALFPCFDSGDVEALTGALISLGLFVPDGERLLAEDGRIKSFKDLSSRDCFEYLAAGIAVFFQRSFSAFQSRGIVKNTVRLIHRLVSKTLQIAGQDRLVPEFTMIKLAEILRREEEKTWGAGLNFSVPGKLSVPSSPVLLRALVLAGLFSVTEGDGKKYYRPALNAAEDAKASPPEKALIAMDSGFSCILYPEITFLDAMDLAAFSSPEETGAAVRFSISRESVIRGFDRGYTAEGMWQLLERLSAGRTEKGLKWNLDDWEKRYREVSLTQGTVLTLDGEQSYLAETGPLASMVRQTLAPGVYLLSAGITEAASALRHAGVDIVARPRTGPSPRGMFFVPLEEQETSSATPGEIPHARETKSGSAGDAQQIKEKFRSILAGMKLSRQEQEELEARIDRRMVVSETQLKDISLRYEKLEARSLDYVGKTGIAKQAISSGSLLELSWNGGSRTGSGEQKILGIPEGLEKKGGEMVLVIKPREGGETLKIPLGKISLLRRIKKSIFGE